MLDELGALDLLIAIDNIDYVTNTNVIQQYQKGGIVELARGPEMDAEKAIVLKPDVVFTFGMGDGTGAAENKVRKANIPLVVSVDHLEPTPLARAEWIKLLAAFTGKASRGDSIFKAVEKSYKDLQSLASKTGKHPTVFSEVRYGDVWYMPGGKSFMSTLLQDAGADYLWRGNDQTGSLPLNFEQVYSKARHADFWLNLPLIRSKADLVAHDPRYAEFDAFKNNRIYNNTLVVNDKGYSSYWESGMIHPERILNDLLKIFHPDLGEVTQHPFNYYKSLPD
jgi:iron complex transport system substrate-binding protein